MMNHNNKYKTVMCKHYQQTGRCNLGMKCHFAHGPEELRTLNDPMPVGQMPSTQIPRTYQSDPTHPGPATVSNYKTIKCKFFEQGLCKYESKCTFAHGDQDIRAQNGVMSQSPGSGSKPASRNTASPTYGQTNAQNQIVQQQINFLITNMEQHHDDNSEYLAILKKATEVNNSGDSQSAASLVYSIINRQNRTQEDQHYYTLLIENLQAYGNHLYQQMQQQTASYPQSSTSNTSTYGYSSHQQAPTSTTSPGVPQYADTTHTQPMWQQQQQQSQHYNYKPSQQINEQSYYENQPMMGQAENGNMAGITNMMGGLNISSNYGQQPKPYNGQVRYQAGNNRENYA